MGMGRAESDAAEVERLRRRVTELEAHAFERKRLEDALRHVAATAGVGVFEVLVQSLAAALEADFVSVSELVGRNRMRTLAFVSNGVLAENFEYELPGTPCEDVVGKAFYVCERDVAARYPLDAWLVENGIESYLGTPLFGRNGEPLGNIAVLSRRPVDDVERGTSLLRLCAVRASAEIEVLRTEQTLRKAEVELREAQKLEAIGRLAGGVAHDFNNLLCVILGRAEILTSSRIRTSEDVATNAKVIRDAAERAAALTKQLLGFARRGVDSPQHLVLDDVVRDFETILGRLAGERVEMIVQLGAGDATVHANRSQLEQVLLNLVANGRDAMPRGGRLILETGRRHADAGSSARDAIALRVIDTGVGMSAETAARAFEPFFSTKPEGLGTGLGLATVRRIVRAMGGEVHLESVEGEGTTFAVELPVSDAPVARRPDRSGIAPRRGVETILLVEDDDLVRPLVGSMLTDLGYRVVVTSALEEAESAVDGIAGDLHLVLTDVMLRTQSGSEVFRSIAARRPEARVLFTSAYPDRTLVREGELVASAPFVEKPFTLSVLAERLREVLDAPRVAS